MKKNRLLFLLCTFSLFTFSQDLKRFHENGNYGYQSKTGEIIVEAQYDLASDWADDGKYLVEINGKEGLVNSSTGKVILSCEYECINFTYGKDFFRVRKDGKWGVIDANANVLVPIKYAGMTPESKGLLAVNMEGKSLDKEWWGIEEGLCNGGKWGYIDLNNNLIIPFKFDRAFQFNNDGLAAVNLGGLFNKEKQYDNYSHWDETDVQANGKWGFINTKGEIVIPIQYNGMAKTFPSSQMHSDEHVGAAFSDNYYSLYRNGKWGVIDKNNTQILPFEFDQMILNWNKSDRFKVKKNTKYGYITYQQEIIIPIIYDEIGDDISAKLIDVKKDGKYGAINNKGETMIPIIYDEIKHENTLEIIVAKKEGKTLMMNEQGKQISNIESKGTFTEDEVMYKIQIGKYLSEMDKNHSSFNKLEVEFYTSGVFYNYTTGKLKTYNEALLCLKIVKEFGFESPFIVAFKNEQRIPIDKIL